MTPEPPVLPAGREDPYPWVEAMQAARRRLPRLKLGIAAAGTFMLGVLAALAAGQSSAGAIVNPTPSASPAGTDIFGQSAQQPGPDNGAPSGSTGGFFGGGDPGAGTQQAPAIVTAPS